jgi:glycosyltransferase involved in cell wall biosynthesis
MVERLASEVEFWIVTADRDALTETPYTDIVANCWNKVGAAQVFYCSPTHRSLNFFSKLIRNTTHDCLYFNSFFNSDFTIKPLLARRLLRNVGKPVVIAPRGEFSPGALALKGRKKALFLRAATTLGLYEDTRWHASNDMEAQQIRHALGDIQQIVIAPNLGGQEAGVHARSRDAGPKSTLRVVFLSRITPKKNLEVVLKTLHYAKISTQLDIVGVVDDEAYWGDCRRIIAALPSDVQVSYKGVVPHDKVSAILAEHDLMFLPTLGENFGHVILESLAAGTPVLISDQTPWQQLDRLGVGWVRGVNDIEGFAKVIRDVANEPKDVADQRRERAMAFATGILEDETAIMANRLLFRGYDRRD